MKRCLRCAKCFEGTGWKCPYCGNEPESHQGLVRFSAETEKSGAGFKAEFFPELAKLEARNFWFRSRNRLICWALKEYFPNTGSVLELGCGTGFVLLGLRQARSDIRLAGSELFEEGLRFAQSRLPGVDLFQMDARRIPFESEFDVVTAFDMLEHINEDELVLSEMFRATRPGGGILLTVPQHPFLWSSSDEYALHQRRYRRAELRQKVQEAGFTLKRMVSFVSLLLPLMILARRKTATEYDPWSELRISGPVNFLLEMLLTVERGLIRAGVSFPVGGSLLVVAKKQAA